MTRKPPNPRPWHCIACGAELPPDRQQGRCRECLIGKRPVSVVTDLSRPVFITSVGVGRTRITVDSAYGKRP